MNPDLVVRDGEGKVMTVRYEAVNAMLLNEFLKEHRKVELRYTLRQMRTSGRKCRDALACPIPRRPAFMVREPSR